MQPGHHSLCKYCRKEILWVRTTRGALAPCDPQLVKADGKALLVFPDGVTARQHLGFTGGYVNHHATCKVWIEMQKRRKAKAGKARATSST